MADRPIKILLFSTLFPHAGEPTLGIFVENRLRNLLAQEPEIEATVIAPVPWFPFKGKLFGSYGRAACAHKVEIRDGLTIYHPRYLVIPKVGMLLTPNFLASSAWRCLKRLLGKGEKFDVIDAHYLYPDAVAASVLSLNAGIPFVATARGSDVTQIAHMSGPRHKILKAVDRAAHTITVSANLKRDLVTMGAEASKISVLRNGVDLEKFKQVDREKGRKKFPDKPILLYAGWLIPRKRLDLVLAVTKLSPDLITVIVGDGPLMAKCQEDARLMGIADRVYFVGQKVPEEMPSYYSLADVLLLPSDREGWANVLLEAMACGTPVVSRAIGGAPDLIVEDRAGRVVDSAKPEDLACAVNDVLKHLPKREKVRQFAEKYGWAETSSSQKRIFEAVLLEHKT